MLIDHENTASHFEHLEQHLSAFDKVFVCYAQPTAKLPLDAIEQVSAAMASGRLQLIKVPSTGKNAADFGICFLAGQLAATLPKTTRYTVLSGDHDLDHVVNLLQGMGLTANRQPLKPKVEDQLTDTESYCAFLLGNKHRPASMKALVNSIAAHLHQVPCIAEDVANHLLELNVIRLNAQKVIYSEAALQNGARGLH